jgi:predicted TIM-barrel fold metal-dependent hydrolase
MSGPLGRDATHEDHPLSDVTVVDTDVHLSVPFDELAAYCDEPYRSITANPTYTPVNRSGWDRYMGGKIESQKRDARDAESLNRRVCGEFGVDVPILNAFPVLNSVPEDDRAVHLMGAYNDYLLEEFLDEFDHFRGLATVATQDPEAAAEELDRVGDEKQIVGVYVLNSGVHPPLGDPRYDPLYRAAADNDLAVAFHASAGAPFARDFPIQDRGLNQFLATHVLAHPWAHMLTLTSLLVEGVPVKFPDLNFAFLEAGYAWVPYLMFRLNKEYSMRRTEAPLLERSPEAYVRDSCYFSSQPVGEPENPEHLSMVVEMLGAERLMLSTDFPHWDFDHPDALDRHVRRFFSDEDRERVMSETAAEAFGLSV